MGTKTNRHIRLVLCVLFFAMAGQAYGDMPSWLNNVSISPPNPTSQNVVTITVSGKWSDSCIPNGSFIWVFGNDIYFEVFRDYPPDIMCWQVVSGWEQTQSVGPLSPDVYTLSVHLNDDWTPGTYVTQFTVSGPAERHVPSEYSTIQAAINASSNGDVIIVQPGEYQEVINFLGKNIAVTSTNPSDSQIVRNTIIEGSSTLYYPYYQAVIFGGTENESCTLTGFNIGAAVTGNHTQATIDHCLLEGTRTVCGTIIYGFDGRISNCLIGPPLIMEQCLYLDYTLSHCHGKIENCTVTGTARIGAGGSATMQNCIFYNDMGPIIQLLSGASLNISYSDLYDSINPIELKDSNCVVNWGPGNINLDPCFVQLGVWDFNEPITYYPGDFHLKSQAGRWNPNTQIWVQDANTSPCIDAGDPNSDWTRELWPNGKRINMGAYGGTPQASMSLSTVGNIANLDNDPCDIVDFNDLAVFVEKWCHQENLLAEDLDRNGHVDFRDYAIFGNKYYETQLGQPDISYSIAGCEMEGASRPETSQIALAESTTQTRFTVTVNGRYIHFEDMMVGNCCTPLSSFWLEMTVNGNLITIYEREELPQYPCLCICDYPVDANSGPFKTGIYTLDVYEDYGGFIGSTTFTIE